jgi:SAM-dependent methyltransferase
MLFHNHTVLKNVEAGLTGASTREQALAGLRKLSLSDFGELIFSMPNEEYPRISAALPAMASDETQRAWTGSSGLTLLSQTIDFVRSVAYNYTLHTGKTLTNTQILDYGCGYGRIARLMYYFTSVQNVVGVDPWDRSIAKCHEAGMIDNFLKSESLPATLPVGDRRFDLSFAFSVFTHLSERANKVCLKAMADYTKDDGLIVITIRAFEHWRNYTKVSEAGQLDRLESDHKKNGFAYFPYENGPLVNGEVIYGETTLTVGWLELEHTELEVVGIDRSLSDPTQIYVFLKKRAKGSMLY